MPGRCCQSAVWLARGTPSTAAKAKEGCGSTGAGEGRAPPLPRRPLAREDKPPVPEAGAAAPDDPARACVHHTASHLALGLHTHGTEGTQRTHVGDHAAALITSIAGCQVAW